MDLRSFCFADANVYLLYVCEVVPYSHEHLDCFFSLQGSWWWWGGGGVGACLSLHAGEGRVHFWMSRHLIQGVHCFNESSKSVEQQHNGEPLRRPEQHNCKQRFGLMRPLNASR